MKRLNDDIAFWFWARARQGRSGGTNWSSYWTTHTDDLDFWSDGIESDGLSLTNNVGSGGALKQLPCLSVDTVAGLLRIKGDDYLMLDDTATYEYYLKTIFPALNTNFRSIISTYYLSPGYGFRLSMEGTGFYFQLWRGASWETLDRTAAGCFLEGLNEISIKVNLATKDVIVTVNGTAYNWTYAGANLFETSGDIISIGDNASSSKEQKLVCFKVFKDDVLVKEFIPAFAYSNSYADLGTIQYDLNLPFSAGCTTEKQDLANPYSDGYALKWTDDALGYQAVSPFNSLNDYGTLKQVAATDIGYHVFDYMEMPDLPIFDTTSRTYWKASIESDAYYVGGTAGRERWFHKSWLDFDWIDAHIEDAYKGLFVVQCRWTKASGQSYIKTKIEHIVLLKSNSLSNIRRDFYETVDLGYLFKSFHLRDDSMDAHKLLHSLGNKRVALDGNFLRYSSDGGHTYSVSFDFSAVYAVANISVVKITSNGNILIFSKTKAVHYSDDNLATVTAASVVNADDSPYEFHVPADANYPGGYFEGLSPFVETDDCLVYGNYTSTTKGASPINFYYSIDDGVTWKVFYTFGQNPAFTDDGTADGGTGGTAMGDAGNPLITTRVEGVSIGFDGNVYIATEGSTTGNVMCNHMMKCSYNAITDAWTVTDLLNSTSEKWPRMRPISCYERNGYIYWASSDENTFDVGGTTYPSEGIWKALVGEINDITKHVSLSVPTAGVLTTHGCIGLRSDPLTSKVIASWISEIHVSGDYGETWEIYDNLIDTNLHPLSYNSLGDYWIGGPYVKIQYLK